MKCPKCGFDSAPDSSFCPKCGTILRQSCAQCGFEAPADFAFCPKCGSELGAQEAIAEEAAPDRAAERLQRLVPREYAERLLATRGKIEAERRMVTILFSDVRGSTAMAEDLDPEEVMEIMDGAFDVLIEPVYRYEGTLARLMGDAVLAFFGAPIAHEDDPERACRAALGIVEGAKEYAARLEQERGITGFNVRVGIHTGLVVVGEVGSDLRVEYTAMGDAINLSARMEQSAPPGGILITHDTYRHVRGVFDVLRQEPLKVKGRHEPVQTYLVQRAKPRAFRKPMRGVEGIETRMVGRQAELHRLQEAFYTAMEDRELQMVTITGDAGVGKSRLLHEFDIWAELLPQTYFFFKGRALQEMQSLPYSLIRDLIAFRFQIEDTDTVPVVQEKLEQGVHTAMGEGDDTQMRAHFVGHLLGFELGPSPHLEGVLDDPKQFRDRVLTYLVEYFTALASQNPVLILLEDLHWADDSSLDVLNHLALALTDQALTIVSAARPALFERRPHWGEGQPFHSQVPLRPLTRRNTRRLLDEILQKVDAVPDTLSDLVVAGAEGNPFFVEELIKMLVEDGVIVKGEEEWRVEPSRLTEVRVPPTLRGVLQARLDRLPLEERTVLQQAAVVGRLFWDRVVVRVHESTEEGAQEADVLDSLSALRGREMVFQRETTAIAGSQEYIFKHAVLREVTYESVLRRLRRVYHGVVADWLMEQGGERASEYTGLIADHLELAGRTAEATDHLLEAGDRARGLYAHQEAIQAYERALALLKREENYHQAARVLMKLGLTYHTAFEFVRARQAYDEGFGVWQKAAAVPVAVSPQPAPHALRLPWHADIPTLDPAVCYDVISSRVVENLFAGLVRLTPDLDIVPDIAASWEVLESGRKYVFHFRDDAKWTDGEPVTAHDCEYAWKRLLDPATGSAYASMLHDVKGAQAYHRGEGSDANTVAVRAIDEWTLEVELEGPAGYFLQLLSHVTTYPVPRHLVEAKGKTWTAPRHLVTNGPFRLETWRGNDSIVLVRNPRYHGDFTGNLERVQLSLVSNWAGSLAKYEAGCFDMLDLYYLLQPEREQAREGHAGELLVSPAMSTRYVAFNIKKQPFDDLGVRQAFAHATDRDMLANVALGGFWPPATGGFVPAGMAGHSPSIALPFNPDLGRHLLAQAGYQAGRGFPAVRAIAPSTCSQDAEWLRTQWSDNLGVDIAFELLEWSDWVRNNRDFHVWLAAWQADYPDPDNFLRVENALPAVLKSEKHQELVERARRLMNQEERMKLYRQADRILVQQAAVVPLTYGRQHLLLKPYVVRHPVSATGEFFWKDVIIEPH